MNKVKNIFSIFQSIDQNTYIDIIIAIGIIVLFCLIGVVISYIIIKLLGLNKKNHEKIKEIGWYYVIKNIIVCFGMFIGISIIDVSENVNNILMKIFKIIVIILISKTIARFLTPKSGLFKKLKNNERFSKNEPLTNFVEKIAKYIVYSIAGFIIIAELGYDLSGLITGLGLGGVIMALAAQDIAKNLFGGAAIILDKPFTVGDLIHTEKYEGTIEDITFRSTRIRTTDDSVITIPNSILSNEVIANWSKLEKRRVDINLKLPLETKSEDLENITQKIAFVLSNNKNIIDNSIKINVNKINNDNIEIIIFMYTNIIKYNDFLDFKQEINITILKILESEKISLAYPGRNIYVQK